MTGGRPGGGRDPGVRHHATSAAAHATAPEAIRRHRATEDAWDAVMTRLLRAAGEIREERERARRNQDARSARAEAAALLEAIRAHGRPNVKHYATRPLSHRAPASRKVMA